MLDRYLFPRRLTRRDFLHASAAAATAMVVGESMAADEKPPVRLGSGEHTYTLDETWGKLPSGMKYGLGCAIVVDGRGRVIITSRSENPCVAIFSTAGELLETWSNDFATKVGYTTKQVASTAHGLYWSREGQDEFLYFTENKPGNRVYKTDLTGRVLYELGAVTAEGSTSQKFQFDNPTDVAVAPNGDIYIVDGYGSQLVHRFDKNFKHLRTIGGRGKEHGKFNVCHGVWVNTLRAEPEVYIADRANNRLEVYSLELEYKRSLPDYRLPCCFYQHKDKLYVPELGARVSIVDAGDQVLARLGDGADIKDKKLVTPDKFATPHALTVDAQGNLYVVEWLDYGRVRKFRHTPA